MANAKILSDGTEYWAVSTLVDSAGNPYTAGGVGNAISANETGNSTQVLLGSSATYTGVWEDVTNYTTVASAVLGSVATDGTLYFDLSTDGGTTYTSVPSSISDTTFAVPRILNVVETHVRIRYVNGTTAMTGTFRIQTKYSNGQELGLFAVAEGFVNSETPVSVTRSILVSRQPDGTYKNEPHNGVSFSNVRPSICK
jgi:hypothetical protein